MSHAVLTWRMLHSNRVLQGIMMLDTEEWEAQGFKEVFLSLMFYTRSRESRQAAIFQTRSDFIAITMDLIYLGKQSLCSFNCAQVVLPFIVYTLEVSIGGISMLFLFSLGMRFLCSSSCQCCGPWRVWIDDDVRMSPCWLWLQDVSSF